jgi:alpha-N-arabinofuranosidase
MRYPGGNFVSGYHWMDGIGPKEQRPTMRDLAWQSIEPNQVGTDEFMKLAHKMNWTPMVAVNLGTGTPDEARNWVEYCNSPTGTKYADLRAANGHKDPFGVKLWCLGNEMDAPWQLGHVPARDYAIRAQQAAKMMKDVDPSIETIASGSCKIDLPTYASWDREILEYIGPFAEYLSVHRYVRNDDNQAADFFAVTNSIEQQIEEMDAVCRYVQALNRSSKRHYLCFDEYNIWYRARKAEHKDGRGKFAPHLIEETFNLEDTLIIAGFLNSFIRHADVVKIANLSQVVNVLAPIMTRGDEMLLQSIYYPFLMYSQRREGIALRPAVAGPGYESKSFGYVDYIDTSAILGDGLLHVFLSNRNLEENAPVTIEFPGGQFESLDSAEIVTGPGLKAENTYDQPDVVTAKPFSGVKVVDGQAELTLPPVSVAALTFKVK